MSKFPDPRLGELIVPYSEDSLQQYNVILFGVPTDEGIRRNGGRVGAAEAPNEIRKQLAKLTPWASNGTISALKIADYGNISGATLEEIHSEAKKVTTRFIEAGKIVIALGGGHDITFPLASGFHDGIAKKDFSLVNIDAHLDVREKKEDLHHSGSSFRLLIEEHILHGKNFTEFGVQQFSFAESHLQWVSHKGAKAVFYEDISQKDVGNKFRTMLPAELPLYLSFDIDSVRSSDAPGCSAPSPIGFRSEDALGICFEAGRHDTTRMLDIAEVNPLFDFDNRTSKLAARMIAWFLLGVSER
ncbi:MAG: formimidoylglutamase [Candidatus Kapaibacterium sp.]